MPAFTDRFEIAAAGGATVFERDPYTWSGYLEADPGGAQTVEVSIGGTFQAAYVNWNTQEWWAGDDHYTRRIGGLRIVQAEIGAGRRWDYNVNSGYVGNVYALQEYVEPELAWWANLNAKIAGASMGAIPAPTSLASGYTRVTVFGGEEGESAEDVLRALNNGMVIRASFGSTIEVNKKTYYTLYGGNILRLYLTLSSVPIAIGETSPGSGGYISPVTGGRLTWSLSYDPANVYGDVVQSSAKVQIRYGAEGASAEYAVPGDAMSFAVPPSLATAGFQWRVQAATEWHEESPWSPWMSVTTVDSLSAPEILSPVNQILEGAGVVTFAWRHVIATGTAQTGWEIEYSADRSLWTPLNSGEGAAQQAEIDLSSLPAGSLYWRVRTRNADGVAGSWSEPALLVLRDAPPAPAVTVTGNTRPKIAWTSFGQQGFEVRVDETSTGLRYGAQQEYSWQEILQDGAHRVGVRIVNEFGLYSPWSQAAHSVRNVPLEPAPGLQAVPQRGGLDVCLYWTGPVDTSAEIWRDGARIAVSSAPGQYIDHTATGRHVYRVRLVDSSGSYADSPQAVVDLPLRDAAIAAEGEWQWVRLADGSGGSLPAVAASYAPIYALTHYSGRVYPVAEVSIQRTASYSLVYELERAEDIAAVRGMLGKIVVHKRRGECLRGFLASVQETRTWWGAEVGLQIEAVSA